MPRKIKLYFSNQKTVNPFREKSLFTRRIVNGAYLSVSAQQMLEWMLKKLPWELWENIFRRSGIYRDDLQKPSPWYNFYCIVCTRSRDYYSFYDGCCEHCINDMEWVTI